jgi:hypothetical protein
MSPEKALVWYTRFTALLFLGAAPFVVGPTEWLHAGHRLMGLGDFPDNPLMQYLARSVSALYTALGALYMFLSCDLRRYFPVLQFNVLLKLSFTVTIVSLELWIPMSRIWIIADATGLVMWIAAWFWLLARYSRSLEEGRLPASTRSGWKV